jgi:hypothetical protein
MNDQQQKLREMLERATARGDDMPADLDAETLSLRESWLALGKLLEDAQLAAGQSSETWQVTLRPTPRRWPLAVAAAIAASLLLAAGLTLAYRLLDGSNAVQPSAPTLAQDDQPATNSTKGLPGTVAQASPSEFRTLTPEPRTLTSEPRTLNSSVLAWDDSLDNELTAVAQAAALVREDWYARAGGVSAIERGLDQIKKDIEDGTL